MDSNSSSSLSPSQKNKEILFVKLFVNKVVSTSGCPGVDPTISQVSLQGFLQDFMTFNEELLNSRFQ